MALRACDGSVHGPVAIRYAAANGARVISISWGAAASIEAAVKEAIDEVISSRPEVVFVASAGNTIAGGETPCSANTPKYPASDLRVIGVAGTDPSGALSAGSFWGTGVSIAAPMEDITTTKSGAYNQARITNAYETTRGTSFSVPQVSATVAMMLTAQPGLSRADVMEILNVTATPVSYTHLTLPTICSV